MEIKKYLFAKIRPFMFPIVVCFISIIAIGIIRQIFPAFFGWIIDSILNGVAFTSMLSSIAFYLSLFIVSLCLHYVETMLNAHLYNKMLLSVRKDCMASIFKTSYTNMVKQEKGKIISTINNDIDDILNLVSNHAINLVAIIVESLIAFIWIFDVNYIIGLYLLCAVILSMFVTKRSERLLDQLYVKQKQKKSEVLTMVLDFLDGKREIFLLNAFQAITDKYLGLKYEQILLEKKLSQCNVWIRQISILSTFLCNMGLMALSFLFIYRKELMIGQYVAITLYVSMIFSMTKFYGFLTSEMPGVRASLKRVHELQSLPPEVGEKTEIGKICKLEFKAVSFSYIKELSVLSNVNFKINLGDILLLKGDSGSGKSTILKNIAGFYDSYQGEIRVNGTELRELDKSTLRKRISACFQGDTLLPYHSIRFNLAYDRGLDDSKIYAALDAVNMRKRVAMLEKGIDTMYDPQETRFSGGEVQRLLLARALLKDADVILLDEVTSAVDQENAERIKRIILEQSRASIIVMASHDSSFEKIATKVYSLPKRYA